MKKRKDGTYSILRQTDRGPIGMFHDLDKKAAERIMKKLDGASDARDRRERGIPDVKGKYAGQRLFASFQEHVDFVEETEEHIEEHLEEMSAKDHYKKVMRGGKGKGFVVSTPIDRERYPNREAQGLEGPYKSRKSGKIFYYDKKAGKYYDPDSDMYLDVSDVMEETEQVDEIVRAKDVYPEIDKIKKVLKKKGIGFHTEKGKIMVNPMNVVEARAALNKAFGGQFEKKTGMEVKAQKKVSLSASYQTEDKMEVPDEVKKIAKELDDAVALHSSQSKRLKDAGIEDNEDMPKNVRDIPKELDKAVAKHKSQSERLKKAGIVSENLNEAVDQKQLLAMYKKLKKGDKIDVTFDSSIRKGKDPMTLIVTSPHRVVGKSKVGRIIFKSVDNMGGVKYFWYNRDDKISMAQGDMAVSPREVKMSTDEGFASDAQRRAAFASGYKAKGKKGKKEEVEIEEGTSDYDKMMKDYAKSDDKKVFDILDKNGYRLGEQGDTLVRNILKKFKGDVKKAAAFIMKSYPGMKKEDVQIVEAYEVTFQFKGSKTKFMSRVKEFQNSGAMTGFSELDKRIEGRPNMVKMTFKSKSDFNKFFSQGVSGGVVKVQEDVQLDEKLRRPPKRKVTKSEFDGVNPDSSDWEVGKAAIGIGTYTSRGEQINIKKGESLSYHPYKGKYIGSTNPKDPGTYFMMDTNRIQEDVQEGKKMKVKLDPNKAMDKIAPKLEDKMSDAEMEKREKIVKSMKKKKSDFKARYGDQADAVMYATATKMAMKESHEIEDVSSINESFDNEFPVSEVEILAANMTPVLRDRWVIKEAPFDDIKKIVADKSMMTVKFPDGRQKVDLMTANVLMTVYDALNDKNKKKFVEKINAKMGNFIKLVQFAYSAVKPK